MEDPLGSALELMLQGMGTVFAFLVLLVATTRLVSWVVRGRAEVPPLPGAGPRPAIDPAVRKAIALAVARYRQDH